MADKKRDTWDKAEIIAKIAASFLIPLTIWYLAYRGDHALRTMQNSEAQLRLRTELLSKREESESALRKDMFRSIIQSFVTPKKDDPPDMEEQLLNLELLAYNFHESLNLKPLFIHLWKKINHSTAKGANPLLDKLERVAKRIARIQSRILEQVGVKMTGSINLENALKFEGNDEPAFVNEKELTLDGISRTFAIQALRANLETKEVQIRLKVRSNPGGLKIFEFWIGFYDFPTIDNVRLSDNQRCALVLRKFEFDKETPSAQSAKVLMLYFPGDYASLKDKPYIDDMIRKLGLKDNQKRLENGGKSLN
jgi:hypothetical protein